MKTRAAMRVGCNKATVAFANKMARPLLPVDLQEANSRLQRIQPHESISLGLREESKDDLSGFNDALHRQDEP